MKIMPQPAYLGANKITKKMQSLRRKKEKEKEKESMGPNGLNLDQNSVRFPTTSLTVISIWETLGPLLLLADSNF